MSLFFTAKSSSLQKHLSKVLKLHGNKIKEEDLEGFKTAQGLAFQCAVDISKELREGWTEKQTADLMKIYLQDHGVKAFFHEPFAWFGDRCGFYGFNNYNQFQPTNRALKPSDSVILDVAPIVKGYTADIGYTYSLKPIAKLNEAMKFLKTLRKDIPKLFLKYKNQGDKIWLEIDKRIKQKGYNNAHQVYPFSVLGHRVSKIPLWQVPFNTPIRFHIHSFASLISKGLFSQLLNINHQGDLQGIWAIEPHVGIDGKYGAKFEEILVVKKDQVYWLEEKPCY